MASPAFSLSSIAKAKRRARRRGPVDPPPGTYDPVLDSTKRQNQRGYDDLLQDYGIGKQRAEDDLNIALGQTNTQTQQSLADLLTNRQRLTEDHTTGLNNLNRGYAELADRQAQGALKANVQSGGILAQALARRQGNMASDQQGLDKSFGRALADSTTAEQRTKLASTDQSDALKLAFERAYGKGGENVLKVARAGRDLVAGNLDISNQKWYAAAAAGYSPVPRRKRRSQIV